MSDYGAPPPPPPLGYGAVPGGQPAGPPPPNYLVLSIVSLLCCWPIGIPAVVFAARVNSRWAMGDAAGAVDSSAKARRFATIALVLGVIASVIYAALALTGALSTGTTSR